MSELVFNPSDWNVPQTVTVNGVDDFIDDNDVNYFIVLDKLKTKDPAYKRQDPADVSLINRDDDVVGFIVTPTGGLQTTEQGGTASFTIQLTSQPIKTVLVRMHSTNIQEGTSPTSRSFNKSNWNKPQTITVMGVNDFIADGDQSYLIQFDPTQGSDPKYIGLVPDSVSLVNLDDDVSGFTVSPTSGLIVNEINGIKTVTVRLNSQPTANVRVFVSGETSGAIVTPQEAVITPTNWTNPVVFTIHGGDVDVDTPFSFLLESESTDLAYAGLSQLVTATIRNTTDETHRWDGTYVGSYSGTVTGYGYTVPINGEVRFTVNGNSITVIAPAAGSGTIDNTGSAQFSPTGGTVSGAVFDGLFTLLSDSGVDASGSWSYSQSGVTGIGSWSASRI